MRLGSLVTWFGAFAVALAGFASARTADRDRIPEVTIPLHEREFDLRSDSMGEHPELGAIDSAWTFAPFQEDREAPSRRYQPALISARRAADSVAAVTEADRPPWTLTGVIIGSPPVAVFEGIPGSADSARVLAQGDQVEEFTVARIRASGVDVVRGRQTWTFTITPPWTGGTP